MPSPPARPTASSTHPVDEFRPLLRTALFGLQHVLVCGHAHLERFLIARRWG